MVDDLISRKAAIYTMFALQLEDEVIYGGSIPEGFDGDRAAEALKKLPSAVVRCMDCKYHIDEEPGMVYCDHVIGGWIKEDAYCSDGERREDDPNT